jgi:hypothetical protein
MTNILTDEEAAVVLRCDVTDADMLALLPIVDAYIKNATGHDWALDSIILPEAKNAARMLLTLWHENPAMISSGMSSMEFGLRAALTQLEAMALSYQQFQGRNGAGAITVIGAQVGETVSTVTGLIGSTGDQKTLFESVITVKGQIQQISDTDLTSKWYRVHLIPLGAL